MVRLLLLVLCFSAFRGAAQPSPKPNFRVLGYFLGNAAEVPQFPYNRLTHVIFCFTQLNGNRMVFEEPQHEAVLQALVAQKKKHPKLKVMVALGGWSGCRTCPAVFASDTGRKAFAASVRRFVQRYQLDGFDMDWESPVIGSKFGPGQPEEKAHFTEVIRELRKALPPPLELSFDANSFRESVLQSFDWPQLMPQVDFVNLMTYGLPNDKKGHTGHHSALYSSPWQTESIHSAIQLLDSLNVPLNKVLIGAAFYGFVVQQVDSVNHGLGQRGKASKDAKYRDIVAQYTAKRGYTACWDSLAQAPYLYSAPERVFITYDTPESCRLKTRYALDHRLGGIMYWKLNGDRSNAELMRSIWDEATRKR